MEDSTTQPLHPNPRARRQKIQLACRNCRDRKTRCGGQRPVCAACERRDVASTCVYERAPLASRRYIAGLEDRIQRLEHTEQPEQRNSPPCIHVKTAKPQCLDQDPPKQTYAPVNKDVPATGSIGSASGHSLSTRSPALHRVDALATVTSEDDDNCLYGESSTIAFVRQVAQGARRGEETVPVPDQETTSTRGAAPTNPPASLLPLDLSFAQDGNHAVLPLRRRADNFLHCYWEFVHPVFPLIHKPTFIARYDQLWLPNDMSMTDDEELLFMANLNLVFALGCQFSGLVAPNQKVPAANEYYKKSRHVLLYDILGSTSASVVQWLLLSGVYLQSTSHASHCWNSVGLAIRLAQGLGLHLEQYRRRLETQFDREMRRRIWHTCVVLDRLLAMTFGRPLMVNNCYNTSIPSLINDEHLHVEGEGTQPPSVPSRLGLFVYSCKLFEILADILSSFYSHDLSTKSESKSSVQEMISHVLHFNRRLDDFITSIPDCLKTTHSSQVIMSDRNTCTNLQQQVLYCRFLYTRLLSLRPLLLMATRREPTDPTSNSIHANLSSLDNDLVQRCCNLCVGTAHRLIETIHQHLDTTYKSSGWHSVYFTFASATILLASIRLSDVNDNGEQTFEASWSRCLSIMEHYKDQIHTAPHAVQVLETLRRQIQDVRDQDPRRPDGNGSFFFETPDGHQSMTPQIPPDPAAVLDLSQFNPYGADSLHDAWFSQHIINLDDMVPDQMYP